MSPSVRTELIAAILANPAMIKAYLAGVPGNGKPFPDGPKMAKIHWNPKKMETLPEATVPGTQHATALDEEGNTRKRFRGTRARPLV